MGSGSDVATTSSQVIDKDSGKMATPVPSSSREETAGVGEFGSRSDVDASCPICMEAWTSGGEHQVCCLPCGHVYGMSCLKKWLLQHCKCQGKCPQCNRKCTAKDIRVLYASRIAVVDDELQKKLRSLEARCSLLETAGAHWSTKETEWRRKEADLNTQVHRLKERTSYLESLLGSERSRHSIVFPHNLGHKFDSAVDGQGSTGSFVLQKDLKVEGARFVDVDSHNQSIIIARRLPGMGGTHVLTKMSLLTPHEREDIQLPMGAKAIKDLRVSPRDTLALLASLGKKLSVVSTESNSAVLNYDLPTAAWSCCWGYRDSHSIYAGLQNGAVLHFDLRQTMRPVQSMNGLSTNPIHSIQSLSADSTLGSGVRSVLSASSVGLCQWNFAANEERPFFIPASENQGVCISLAYSPWRDNIVASYRPKIQTSGDITASQPMLSPPTSLLGQEVQGCHVVYKRVGSRYEKLGSTMANVNDIRLPKSAIVDRENLESLFISGHEATGELVLQELPSFEVSQRLRSASHPVRDVKYIDSLGLLCSLCDDILQLYSTKKPF